LRYATWLVTLPPDRLVQTKQGGVAYRLRRSVASMEPGGRRIRATKNTWRRGLVLLRMPATRVLTRVVTTKVPRHIGGHSADRRSGRYQNNRGAEAHGLRPQHRSSSRLDLTTSPLSFSLSPPPSVSPRLLANGWVTPRPGRFGALPASIMSWRWCPRRTPWDYVAIIPDCGINHASVYWRLLLRPARHGYNRVCRRLQRSTRDERATNTWPRVSFCVEVAALRTASAGPGRSAHPLTLSLSGLAVFACGQPSGLT
jgi:hypothetical protein